MFDKQCKKFAKKVLGERQSGRQDGQQQEAEIQEISVSDALRKSDGSYKMRGQIASYGSIYMMVRGRKDAECNHCGVINTGVRFKMPRFLVEDDNKASKCINCSKEVLHKGFDYIPTIDVDIQDPDQISEVNRIQVHVFDEDTR